MLWGHIFAIISLVYKYSAQQGNESMLEVRVEKMLVGYVVVVLASRFLVHSLRMRYHAFLDRMME